MSKPKSIPSDTNAASSETKNPFRMTIEVAVGPNTDGHALMAQAAHADVAPPDPAIVDDPEAPELPAPTPTQG
jgi:hypothetical protein